MPDRGWICPGCGKAHSPDTKTCPSDLTPDIAFPLESMNPKCCVCGMRFKGSMGYCCTRNDCPSRVICG